MDRMVTDIKSKTKGMRVVLQKVKAIACSKGYHYASKMIVKEENPNP